jgi:ceramide synthetase
MCVHYFLQRLGKRFVIGSTKHLSQAELEERQKKHIKFKESGWKFMYYLSGEIFALAVSYNEPWFMDSSKYFVGPGDQVWPDQSVT